MSETFQAWQDVPVTYSPLLPNLPADESVAPSPTTKSRTVVVHSCQDIPPDTSHWTVTFPTDEEAARRGEMTITCTVPEESTRRGALAPSPEPFLLPTWARHLAKFLQQKLKHASTRENVDLIHDVWDAVLKEVDDIVVASSYISLSSLE